MTNTITTQKPEFVFLGNYYLETVMDRVNTVDEHLHPFAIMWIKKTQHQSDYYCPAGNWSMFSFSSFPGVQLSLIYIGTQKGCSHDISVCLCALWREGWEDETQSWRTINTFSSLCSKPQYKDRMETNTESKGRHVTAYTIKKGTQAQVRVGDDTRAMTSQMHSLHEAGVASLTGLDCFSPLLYEIVSHHPMLIE